MTEITEQEPKTLRVPSTVKNLIEALVFAAKEPLSVRQIKAIYEYDGAAGRTRTIEADEIRTVITQLNEESRQSDKPYRIIQVAGGYQFATQAQYAEWLGKLYKEQARRKLSQSGIETLAIVAYKQPISRPEIEAIRGVNCEYVLATLLEKDLVTIVGRAPTPGRPLLYGTTREFLKYFGLNEVTDLPRPREIEEILGESQFETERRMLEAQAGAEKVRAESDEDFKSRLPHIPKQKPSLDGEVEIVPRKRARELKSIMAEKPVTDPGQERLLFESGGSKETTAVDSGHPEGMIDRPAEEPPAVERIETGVPHTAPQERKILEPDPVIARKEVELLQEPESQPPPQAPAGPSLAEPVAPDSTEYVFEPVQPAPMPASAAPHELPDFTRTHDQQASEPPSKSKWHTWKEKIQTFMKKLFA